MPKTSTPTLEEFTTGWIAERLRPEKRNKISSGEMPVGELQTSIRSIILQHGLLDVYTSTHGGPEILIGDTTIASLAAGVAKRIVALCKKKS